MITVSKYTTEVRFICENKAGLTESKGASDVDTILTNSWDKIFTTQCTFFDPAYRAVLCKKILKHYYLREIGSETVGIWLLWMNTKLEEIMPYYNQLYASALLEFDPFKDTDYQRTHEGENTGSRNTDTSSDTSGSRSGNNTLNASDTAESHGNSTSNNTTTDSGTISDVRDTAADSTANSSGNKGDRYSDTPQGTISNVDVTNNAYLTNVRLIDDSTSGISHDETLENNLQSRALEGTNNTTTADTNLQTAVKDEAGTFSESNSQNNVSNLEEQSFNTDAYIEHVFGKVAATPYSDLLQKFRDTFLNIDTLVIEEFNELFMQLW